MARGPRPATELRTVTSLPNRPPRLRAEAARLLTLAVPLVLSTGCFSITLFVDRALLMWDDPAVAGAALSAGNVYWTCVCLPVMAIGFLPTIVSQCAGRGRGDAVGPAVWQGVWLTALAAPLFVLLGVFAPAVFSLAGHEASLAASETAYFRWLMLVAPGSMLEAALSAFFVGRGVGRPVLAVNVLASVVNVALDWVLIFGWGPIPALHEVGAAQATAAAMWLKVAAYVWLIRRSGGSFGFGDRGVRRPLMTSLFSRGMAVGVQQVFKTATVSGVLLAIGTAGGAPLAATTVVLSLVQLATIPLVGLSTALTSRVGQLCEGGGRAVKPAIYAGIGLFGVCVAGDLLAAWASGGTLTRLFLPEAEATAEVAEWVATLAPWGVLLLVADTVGLFSAGVVRGVGETRVLLTSTLAASGIVGVLSVCGYGAGPEGAWRLLAVWSFSQALLSTWWLARRTAAAGDRDLSSLPIPEPAAGSEPAAIPQAA